MSSGSFTPRSASSSNAVVPKVSSAVASRLWQVAHASPINPSSFASNGGTNAITNVSASGTSTVASNVSSSGASASSGPSSGSATGIQPAKVSLSAVSAQEDKCFRPLLPVQVEFSNGKKAFTYTLLDSGSNRAVMMNAFIKRMGAPTRQEMISLQGLGVVSTGARMVGAAKIGSVVDKKVMNEVEFVEVDAIPVDESHVATNRDAEKYGHFRGIQLVELQRKEVGVLIGTDCSNAFSVLEVRKAKQNEPIAWKTHYGWCLLGEVGHGARKGVL